LKALGLKQPYENMSTIITAEKLVDLAFSNASKLSIPRRRRNIVWVRKKEKQRIRAVEATVTSKLNKIIKKMPRIEELHPFYIDLTEVLVGTQNLKKSLAALNWAVRRIQSFSSQYSKKLSRAGSISVASNLRREAYGRIASVLKQVSRDLDFLEEARRNLSKLPSIDTGLNTIIVAGYANVGKSTLVRDISTAKPEIATYPFTTKKIFIGHREIAQQKFQIVDTPGLLDRPLSKRNKIELQAIIAMRHLSSVIIFVFDPSETCGYPLNSQTNLFKEISAQFKGVPIIKVLNKIDLASENQIMLARQTLGEDLIDISALKNMGVDDMFRKALNLASRENVTQS
jgi:nucleolar GTP-binding protein